MNMQGKVALITGAAMGIGYATAIKMATNGADLVLFDLNGEKLAALQEKLAAYPVRVKCYVGDVSDEEAVKAAVADALTEFGKIDILVNNAAIWRCWAPFLETPIADWKKYIDVNVMSCIYFCHAVLPGMVKNGWGRVINVASVAGVYGNSNMAHYSATKGAVIAFTKSLAREMAAHNVLVNAVSPGSVSPSENDDYDYYRESDLSCLGRTGTDMENANLICFLASDESSYISGQNIQIDGCRKAFV